MLLGDVRLQRLHLCEGGQLSEPRRLLLQVLQPRRIRLRQPHRGVSHQAAVRVVPLPGRPSADLLGVIRSRERTARDSLASLSQSVEPVPGAARSYSKRK